MRNAECGVRIWAVVVVAVAWAVLLSGCSFLAPGLDTRVAAVAKSKTTWDADNNLTIDD